MKLDKLIRDSKLVERLDKLDPDNASGSKNDGINYWRGKKIVTIAEWKKIAKSDKALQKGIEDQKIKEALQYFPDDYEDSLFPLAVSPELIEVAEKWQNQYLELMQFRNNSKCGRSMCFDCLLCPDKEKGRNYVGICRLVAGAIEVNNEEQEDDNLDTPTTAQSPYPCSVLNRFKCPYDRKDEMKRKKPKHQQQERNDDEESNSYDVDYLFFLSDYSFRVESAFIRARKEKSTIVSIKSVEDIYHALTNREILDKLLQQDLDKEHLKYKDEIVEFFMSIKGNIKMEDLTYYKSTDT